MFFREGQKGATLLGRRWLRELFFEDWALKLLALLIALGLWYAVTGQRAPATVRLRNVPLFFVLPSDMEISNDPREQVEVTLRGSRRALEAIKAGDLVVNFDASSYRPGERMVRLTPQNVTLELPEEVSAASVAVERIEPATVPLRLERRIEREVEVKVQFEGQPPPNFSVVGGQPKPATIRVRGPESLVNALPHALTETISLDSRSESFTVAHAAIDIPERKIVPLETVVDVIVNIEEERLDKVLPGVAVRLAETSDGRAARPALASVTLRGPRSIVGALRPADISLVLAAQDGTLQPRLFLPPNLQGRVELLSTAPANFSISK
ncbi:MAG: CdaR family protein [Acidobacteriota bacterium]|nr:CdaR family protein [Acidobacteriota bacterium]